MYVKRFLIRELTSFSASSKEKPHKIRYSPKTPPAFVTKSGKKLFLFASISPLSLPDMEYLLQDK